MWCRPVPSSVSPMYMPGRLRPASRPLRTWMLSWLYEPERSGPFDPFPFVESLGGFVPPPVGGSDVVIVDRSIARPRGILLQLAQASPPATNLNSFNNLASFTRTVKELITDSEGRVRRSAASPRGAHRERCGTLSGFHGSDGSGANVKIAA